MEVLLNAEEARVLGCLIEKERTTPEYYPLTVNALLAACNQKTSRDPVVQYDEPTIMQALRSLDERGFIGLSRSSGGRSTKYVHRTEDVLEIDSEQVAVLAVLLLRGAQTPGELRSRTERYFATEQPLETIETVLDDLMTRSNPLVERLARQPGQKESRYRCLLTDAGGEPAAMPITPPPAGRELVDRVERLERIVEEIAAALDIDLEGPS